MFNASDEDDDDGDIEGDDGTEAEMSGCTWCCQAIGTLLCSVH